MENIVYISPYNLRCSFLYQYHCLVYLPDKEVSDEESSTDVCLCPLCGKNVSKRNYSRHMKRHISEFKCSQCSHSFDDQESLDQHHKAKHSDVLLCSYCGKNYNYRSALNEHIRVKHEQSAKMFPCVQCDKKFTRVGHLKDHINTHYDCTPYTCPYCDRSYSKKASFSRHVRECRGQTRSHPETMCHECSRTFSSATALRDHHDSEHRGKVYTCECGSVFKWRAGLSRHKQTCVDAAQVTKETGATE